MHTKAMFKGIGIGLVAGSILTATIVPIDKKRVMRSKTGRVLRTVGHLVEGVCDAFN